MNPGGVTQVILFQIKALKQYPDLKIELWLGEPPAKSLALPKNVAIKTNPLLKYLPKISGKKEAEEKLHALENWFQKELAFSDILHIHNLNLGKNPLLNLAVHWLAEKGYKIINHCHDFAEDGRPDNMNNLKKWISIFYKGNVEDVLYPAFSNYQFALINGRDFENLKKIGVGKNRVHLAQNPIEKHSKSVDVGNGRSLKELFQIAEQKQLWVYPVRGIRRKNLGEMLLLSVLFSRTHVLGITQPPKNPLELKFYNNWKKFAKANKIPFLFEMGIKADFDLIKNEATGFFTTSVSEGFGMAFLEPWTWGKTLAGRDLPEITQQFKKGGLKFPRNYKKLWVPYSWVLHKAEFWKAVQKNCEANYKANGLATPKGFAATIKNQLLYNGKMDFCYLDSMRQQDIIKRVLISPEEGEWVLRENKLSRLFSTLPSKEILDNKNCIYKNFGITNYGETLWNIYEFLYSQNKAGRVKKKAGSLTMAQIFSNPSSLHLIRK